MLETYETAPVDYFTFLCALKLVKQIIHSTFESPLSIKDLVQLSSNIKIILCDLCLFFYFLLLFTRPAQFSFDIQERPSNEFK